MNGAVPHKTTSYPPRARAMSIHRPALKFAICSTALLALGLSGTWAFNPQDAAVVKSDPLWIVFAIATYMGMIGLVAFGLAALFGIASSTWTALRHSRRR